MSKGMASMPATLPHSSHPELRTTHTDVKITPRQARLFSSFSKLMQNSVRKSRLRLLTGGLLNFIVATPVPW